MHFHGWLHIILQVEMRLKYKSIPPPRLPDLYRPPHLSSLLCSDRGDLTLSPLIYKHSKFSSITFNNLFHI